MNVLICNPLACSVGLYTVLQTNESRIQKVSALKPVLKTFVLDYELWLCLQVHATEREQVPWFASRMTVGNGGVEGLDDYKASRPVEVWGVVVASRAIKIRQPSSGDLGVGLCPGREGVLLIYEPLCSLVNKNKTAGVITNSLLTGSIIYERREEVLQARGFFGIPTRPELGWCGEDPAWGAPTASPAQAWCTVPWVQGEKGWGADVESWRKQSTTSLWQASIRVLII